MRADGRFIVRGYHSEKEAADQMTGPQPANGNEAVVEGLPSVCEALAHSSVSVLCISEMETHEFIQFGR